MKVVGVLLTAVAAVPQQPSFEEWAAVYGVNGDDMKANYEANVVDINRLNALGTTAVFGVNQFSGMSSEEFAAVYLNYQEPENFDNSSFARFEYSGSVASSIDWVEKGGVTAVKNQGRCGSCWAFSAIATIEARHKILTGEDLDLSEQQVVDCSGAGSCNGGKMNSVFYWLGNNSVCTSSSYAYTGKDGSCKSSCTSSHLHVSQLIQVDPTESALEEALNDAPVSNLVNGNMLQHYTSGILQGNTSCSHNHAILVVGYTSDYWKIKNSWGKGYGEDGYVRIERGGGSCGKFGMLSSHPKSIKLKSDIRRRRSTSKQSDIVV